MMTAAGVDRELALPARNGRSREAALCRERRSAWPSTAPIGKRVALETWLTLVRARVRGRKPRRAIAPIMR